MPHLSVRRTNALRTGWDFDYVKTDIFKMARVGVAVAAIACITSASIAQTVPDDSVPKTNLDIPQNLQIFGKVDPSIRKPTAIVNGAVITGTDVDQRVALARRRA